MSRSSLISRARAAMLRRRPPRLSADWMAVSGRWAPWAWLARAVARCQQADPAFPRITAHDLRHTAASLAISAGANPKVVQRMLGHASAAMTLDVYADLFSAD